MTIIYQDLLDHEIIPMNGTYTTQKCLVWAYVGVEVQGLADKLEYNIAFLQIIKSCDYSADKKNKYCLKML